MDEKTASFPRVSSVSSSQFMAKPQQSDSEAGVSYVTQGGSQQPPKRAATEGNPGQGSRPAHITGKVLERYPKGCKHTGKADSISPLPIAVQQPLSQAESPHTTTAPADQCLRFTYIFCRTHEMHHPKQSFNQLDEDCGLEYIPTVSPL